MIERGNISQYKDAAIVFNTWAEAIIHATRFGMVGTNDFQANAIIRITGGSNTCPSGNGPNTIFLSDVRVIPFGPETTSLWQFKSLSNNLSCTPALIYKVADSHIENVSYMVSSDSSVNRIQDLWFVNSSMFGNESGDSNPSNLANLNAATQITNWWISNSFLSYGGVTMTLAPTPAIQNFNFINNVTGANSLSITAPSGSTGTISGLDNQPSITGAGITGFKGYGTLMAPLISLWRYMEEKNLTEGAEFAERLEPARLTFEL